MERTVVDSCVRDDLDDMSVAYPREEPRLSGHCFRDLEHDQAIFEVRLFGQKNASESAAPQLSLQDVWPDLIAGFERDRRWSGLYPAAQKRRRTGNVQPHESFERHLVLRKTGQVIGNLGLRSPGFRQTIVLVDKLDGAPRISRVETVEVIFNRERESPFVGSPEFVQ